MIEHHSVVNLVKEQIQGFKMSEKSRVLQYASMSFDASVSEVMTTLVAGGRLEIIEEERRYREEEVRGYIEEREITTVTLPPALMRRMGGEGMRSLEVVVSAGEASDEEVVRRWREGREVINAYGPTESTVCATMGEMREGRGEAEVIGRAIGGVKVRVEREGGEEVGIGIEGELMIGGEGVGRGYVGREEETAERYVPGKRGEGEREYRSGDRVKVRGDGRIEYRGRRDGQVKVRGYRVETGEIEEVIREQAEVLDAIVMANNKAHQTDILVAYVVPRPRYGSANGQEYARNDPAISASELRSFLQQKLPEYMIPSSFVILDEFPLTTSGKIDRKALAKMDRGRTGLAAYVAPRTPIESSLAEIWSEVLGVEEIGIHDNFFELGGHSLLATQVVSRVRDTFNVEMPASAVFDAPTIAEFSVALVEKQAGSANGEFVQDLLAEISQLSDAEVESILAEEQRKSDERGGEGAI
jgi:acyl-coenzyme A synthetase/AMP-(fatty) acid ligase/acyl carrier protein